MLPEHRTLLEDELCPVADQTLGEMYRASPHGLSQLIATVSPTARILLALFCYRRAHLASIGLAIAATCEKDELTWLGGNAGAVLFERSREAPKSPPVDVHGRRKITLPTAPIRQFGPIEDEEDWDTDGSHLAHLGPDAQPDHHKPALVETFQQVTAGDLDQAAIDGIKPNFETPDKSKESEQFELSADSALSYGPTTQLVSVQG